MACCTAFAAQKSAWRARSLFCHSLIPPPSISRAPDADNPKKPLTAARYGWEGCITTEPPVVAYDHDYGVPTGPCAETAAGAGIFIRAYSKATISMDCNSFQANITLAGHAAALT